MRKISVALLAASLFAGIAWGFSARERAERAYLDYLKQVSIVHTVERYQTLWQIAKTYHPDKDPRLVIAYIRKINGLEGPSGPVIHPGQEILVPKDF